MPSSKHPTGYGRHKIFLGYAPGVGKTYQMLEESVRRRERGQDVVVGLVDQHGRPATQEILGPFESIPPVNGALDVDKLIDRAPDFVLVDEIHETTPGGQRYEDVERLLAAGVNVLSTLDVMYLESLNDTVADILGERPANTVPDRILQEAEEVELIDLTPRALVNRLERGVVLPLPLDDKTRSFYRLGNLSALREIAMREAASHVDEDLFEYRREKRIEKPWAATDRVLVLISPTRSSMRLIRRAWRMGQRMHGDVIGLHVREGAIGAEQETILANDFALCKRLNISTREMDGPVTETVVNFAKEHNVTAIILGHPERSRFSEVFRPSILSELARELRTVDIIVVGADEGGKA